MSMKKVVLFAVCLMCSVFVSAQDIQSFVSQQQGTLHMVKSLNLVDLSPLDKEAMPLIFTKTK
jgi:hypothetical protein